MGGREVTCVPTTVAPCPHGEFAPCVACQGDAERRASVAEDGERHARELLASREREAADLRARLETAEAQAAARREWIETNGRHAWVADQMRDGCYERAPACTCPPGQHYSHALSCAVATERGVMLCKCERDAALSGDAGAALLTRLRAAEAVKAMLLAICAESPPDDWDVSPDGEYPSYGERGDRAFVEVPDESSYGDVHSHGFDMGAWSVSKRVRSVLVTGIPSPFVSLDGGKWCALYGPNLQDGVAGFGDSPEEAREAFVAAWRAAGGGK